MLESYEEVFCLVLIVKDAVEKHDDNEEQDDDFECGNFANVCAESG